LVSQRRSARCVSDVLCSGVPHTISGDPRRDVPAIGRVNPSNTDTAELCPRKTPDSGDTRPRCRRSSSASPPRSAAARSNIGHWLPDPQPFAERPGATGRACVADEPPSLVGASGAGLLGRARRPSRATVSPPRPGARGPIDTLHNDVRPCRAVPPPAAAPRRQQVREDGSEDSSVCDIWRAVGSTNANRSRRRFVSAPGAR
jgi:hypothetical protein